MWDLGFWEDEGKHNTSASTPNILAYDLSSIASTRLPGLECFTRYLHLHWALGSLVHSKASVYSGRRTRAILSCIIDFSSPCPCGDFSFWPFRPRAHGVSARIWLLCL